MKKYFKRYWKLFLFFYIFPHQNVSPLAKKQCRNITKLTKKDITKFLENALKEDAGTLIETLINKIILYNDKKEIYFNNPLKNKGPDDKSQDFLFYTEIKNADRTSEIVRFYLWFFKT